MTKTFGLHAAALATATMLLWTAIPATAHAQSAAAQQACRADYTRFCADTPRGGGRIIACLKSHNADLSAPCKEALASTK